MKLNMIAMIKIKKIDVYKHVLEIMLILIIKLKILFVIIIVLLYN